MYFEENLNVKEEEPIREIFIYQNSSNLKNPLTFRLRKHENIFKEISKTLKYRKLRLFNSQGAEYFEDDFRFIKNKATIYASRGEDFDPHNCFGEYQIEKKLGEGGFGEVFLAKHKHTKEKCAIKIIKISSSSDIDSIFVEAQILKSLKHENIVKVENCLTLKNMQVAIIMEYLEGGELLKYVQKQGTLDEECCKIFLRQIVKGIMYCHASNLIHRDLKLENILLVNSQEKRIKIIDFGIAGAINRLKDDDLDTGSLGYMAPECFSEAHNHKFDGRMDVWAIGVILYCMLVGELPFKGSTYNEIRNNICKSNYKIPAQRKKELSKQCLSLLSRCLEINPKGRIAIEELNAHSWLSKSCLNGQKPLQNLLNVKDQNPLEDEDNIVQIITEKKKQSKNSSRLISNKTSTTKSRFGQKTDTQLPSGKQNQSIGGECENS